ncbi:hypothetical protein LTR62_006273 [Meristemomyces frigidus]|uniref:DUF654-domain-containing protein n=1 Tax=Meristemomyces frigidus TaxID=1508187 RepID=A0AAN7TD66_9PEZI|nr:hypothetical protein LTR62_006273 [Meristemomyces frigidus]
MQLFDIGTDMSSRALRKAQREREAQEQVERIAQEQEQETDQDGGVDSPVVPTKASAFAMLGEDVEDEDQDGGAPLDDHDDDDAAEAEEGTTALSKQTISTGSKMTKKKKKKKKKQATGDAATVETNKDEELDEIDRALKQLSTSGNAAHAGSTAAGMDATIDEASSLLAIDTTHLHAQNELKKLFGRAALEQQNDEDEAPQQQGTGGNRRQQRQAQQMGLAQALRGQGGANGRSGGLAAAALRRNIFIQGKEDWPVGTSGGLGMEIESKLANGTILYRFVHNKAYQDVQAQFETCVESMDPDRMVMLLRHNPYHISTLLQVFEIAKQQGDHATSGDLLERALFSFGRTVHSTFSRSIADGKARLDFRRPENREFWLASWRYMMNLSMRGTWRTVYEWCKLLLSIAPQEDPYGLWLVLDQYALRSRQDLDYLNVSRNQTFRTTFGSLPNVQISQAFAEFRAGNKGKGKQALFTTIGRFPWIFFRLMRELNLDPPPGVWGKESASDKDELYTILFATRAKDLWNTPEITALLVEVASAVQADVAPTQPNDGDITEAESRHVVLSDVQPALQLLPKSHRERLTISSDPLPPSDNLSSYTTPNSAQDTRAQTATENVTELRSLYSWFSQHFPSMAAAAVEGGEQPETEEEVRRQVEASGVSRQVLLQRTERLGQLQRSLAGMGWGLPGAEGEDVPGAWVAGEGPQDVEP